MRRLFVAVFLLLAVVVGLGIYRDWFHFSTSDKDTGKVNVDLSIDKDKMKADAEAAKEKAKTLGAQARGAVTPASGHSPPSAELPNR